MVICLHQRWKWRLKFAGRERSTRRICFYWLSCMLLVWHKLIWEKVITTKRITIERNKNKDIIIIITTPGNKILTHSIIFFYYQRKQELKTKDGRDLITTSTLMTAVTNNQSFQCRETKHAYKWLSFKKMPIQFFYMVVLWLKTSVISDCAAQLLNTYDMKISKKNKINRVVNLLPTSTV